MLSQVIQTGNIIGKGIAGVYLIVGIIFSLIFGAVGVFLILRKEIYSNNITAKVKEAKCDKFTKYSDDVKKTNPKTMFNCSTIKYSYIVGDKTYDTDTILNDSMREYKENDQIDVQYNPNEPSQSRLKQPKSKFVGIIFIVVSLFLFLASYTRYYIISKVRGAGSIYTAKKAYNYFTNNNNKYQ